MNYTILGCGRWGGFIEWYLDKTGHKITTLGLETDPYVVNLFATRKNNYVEFPESIELTTDLKYALGKNDYVIISISSQNLRSLMQSVKAIDGYKDKNYIICMKGIEESTGSRLSEVIASAGIDPSHIATWVGPGHIQEFTRGVPGVMIVDSYNKELSQLLVNDLKSDLIRYYQGQDMVGTEIGAAAKNVMGIAAGMLDGADISSLKGALMARGTREIARLIKAAGGNELSAYGLCHLGDYEATVFSQHSHNRMFGEKFARGEDFGKLAEGVPTLKAVKLLADEHGIDMPISQALYQAIYEKGNIKDIITKLFERSLKREFS